MILIAVNHCNDAIFGWGGTLVIMFSSKDDFGVEMQVKERKLTFRMGCWPWVMPPGIWWPPGVTPGKGALLCCPPRWPSCGCKGPPKTAVDPPAGPCEVGAEACACGIGANI